MSILKVARMGHPVLRKPARPLAKSDLRDPLVQKLIDDMIDTMYEYRGVGLAAPQVHEDLRLFVGMLDDGEDEDVEPMALINPEITPLGDEKVEGREGCLSIPEIYGMVPRFVEIAVNALDRSGKPIDLRLKGYPARVVQHETDHLDGVLFLDRMTSMQSLTFLAEYSRFHGKEDED
jgi:peptide deformylase